MSSGDRGAAGPPRPGQGPGVTLSLPEDRPAGRDRAPVTTVPARPGATPNGDTPPPATPRPRGGASGASASTELPTLPTIDPARYSFGEEYGRGGLGRVMRATDLQLGRPVAIKELLVPRTDLEGRFLREAIITARLQHPGIVPVYEAGRWPSGEPFYAMRSIPGRSLDAALDEAHSLDDRLALLPRVLAAARAIAYAHNEAVIHRDLKPSNIMLGPFGETVVIDWGLAKVIGTPDAPLPASLPPRAPDPADPSSAASAASAPAAGPSTTPSLPPRPDGPRPADLATPEVDATRFGSVMGTPCFMAPEQARGEPADARADVYALGAILYMLLGGKAPYYGLDADGVIAAVATRPPQPLAELAPDVAPELLALVDKAMAHEPDARYPDADAFAGDLERYTTGQLVGAHRYGLMQLFGRFVRRHLPTVIATASLLVVLAVVAVISVRKILAARRNAERERLTAVAERQRAEARYTELVLAQARAALRFDPTATLAWLRSYPDTAPGWGGVRQLIAAAEYQGVARHVLAHSRAVCCLITLPGNLALAGDASGAVMRWDLATGQGTALATRASPVEQLVGAGAIAAWVHADGAVFVFAGNVRQLAGPGDEVRQLAVSADGKRVAALTLGQLRVWDVAGNAPARAFDDPQHSNSMSFVPGGIVLVDLVPRTIPLEGNLVLPEIAAITVTTSGDGKRWALGSHDGRVIIGDASGKPPLELRVGEGRVGTLLLSHDGSVALTSMVDVNDVRIWDVDHAQSEVPDIGSNSLMKLALSPDGKRAVSLDVEGHVLLWQRGVPTRRVLGHSGTVVAFAFTSDGTLLSAGDDQAVRVWAEPRGAPRARFERPGGVVGLAQPRSGDWLAVSRLGETVMLHDAQGDHPLGDAGRRARLLADPRGKWLLAADDELVRFELATGERRVLGTGHVSEMLVSADGRLVVAGGKPMRLWDMDTLQERPLPPVAGEWLALAPDGSTVALGDREGNINLLGFGGAPVRKLGSHGARLALLRFTPGGELVSCDELGELRRWNVPAGTMVRLGSRGPTSQAELSPDGRTVALTGDSNQIRLIDVASGAERALTGHADQVFVMEFSPDSTRLASGSGVSEMGVRVWDVASAESRAVGGPTSLVSRILWRPDGRSLVFGDGSGVVWELDDALPEGPAALRARIAEMTSAVSGAADLPWTP
ncbi:MAG: protein kinase [Deltaproteobacteria bacterium]|nr:protein kinase [Deltaproteobacteria bacterium]